MLPSSKNLNNNNRIHTPVPLTKTKETIYRPIGLAPTAMKPIDISRCILGNYRYSGHMGLLISRHNNSVNHQLGQLEYQRYWKDERIEGSVELVANNVCGAKSKPRPIIFIGQENVEREPITDFYKEELLKLTQHSTYVNEMMQVSSHLSAMSYSPNSVYKNDKDYKDTVSLSISKPTSVSLYRRSQSNKKYTRLEDLSIRYKLYMVPSVACHICRCICLYLYNIYKGVVHYL